MKRKALLLLTIIFGLVLAGCTQSNQKSEHHGLTIVTSFYPIYAITQEIAGEENDVQMIQSGSGIHGFEPSAADVKAITDSDLFIYHSDTLESWAAAIAKNITKDGGHVLEASKDQSLDKVEGLEDIEAIDGMDGKHLYDPHTWLDPELAAVEAQTITTELSERDPANKDHYQKRAEKFKQQTEQLIKKYQQEFQNTKQKTFVTQHTAFSYLAKRFGLKQLGIAGITSEQEAGAQRLAEIEDFVKKYHVQTIFVEPNVSTKVADVVASSTGVEIETLSPLEADPKNTATYLENLEQNLKILHQTLVKESKDN
ncbi:MAG: zinc ABC transporter substrate-binding protein [Aerococcus sp.]|nr:zinc ABC transporter substrate-binding protein [Aerococcus sp.]